MASLSYHSAFELCGEKPTTLAQLRRRTAAEAEQANRSERSRHLARIVESEIIPRLAVVHAAPEKPIEKQALGPELIEKFALHALSMSPDSLLAIVGGLLQHGATMESIYLDLLAPAARRLGDYWMEDKASYADVTIALGRLHQIVRELSVHGPDENEAGHAGRAALFAPAPGEQHTFGIVIIEEFFRRSGWRTWTEVSGDVTEVVNAARAHHFDLVGLTASGVERLEQLAQLIMSIRSASRNREISVLVGGRLFLEQPSLASAIGADGTALDAREAVLKAEASVRQLSRP